VHFLFLLRKSEFERRAIQEFISHVVLVGFVEFVYIWSCWLTVVRLTQTDVGGTGQKELGQNGAGGWVKCLAFKQTENNMKYQAKTIVWQQRNLSPFGILGHWPSLCHCGRAGCDILCSHPGGCPGEVCHEALY